MNTRPTTTKISNLAESVLQALSARLSPPKAAEYVGLACSTMAKLRVVGGGPLYRKLGRRVVYDLRDLDAWLDARKRANTSEE